MHYRKGGQGRGQEPGPLSVGLMSVGLMPVGALPVGAPADDEHHPDGGGVGQGGQDAAGEAQVQGAPVGEWFRCGEYREQGVNQDAAQGEPVGVEGAFRCGQRGAEVGQAGAHLRVFPEPCQILVAGVLGQHAEHIHGAEVEGAFVGVKTVSGVPVDAVQAEGQGRQ